MTILHVLSRQVGLHQRSFWRNPESAFFNFAMPLGVLAIFGATASQDAVPGRTDVDALTLFVPGILGFAIVVVAYGNLAATISVRRADGVLKRLRATPLRPWLYVAGHLANVLVISALISVATIALGAAAFGAVPRVSAIPQLLGVLTLGTICFASLGVAISAAIPSADSAGAITNGTYLPLAMVSGMFSVAVHLPRALNAVVGLFPLKPLADGLRSCYDPAARGWPVGESIVLAAWAVVGIAVALRFFRWDRS